jgi:hypothetical protein
MKHLIHSLTVAIFFTACATQQTVSVCQNTDWYEIGREDGSLGRTLDRFEVHKKSCSAKTNTNFEALYMNGRDRGLIEFCTPQNGFALGKSGEIYSYVCPFHLESKFLTEYRRGQKVYDLEKDNLKLEQRMANLFSELRKPASTVEQMDLQREMTNLRQARAKNDRELSRLNSQ